MKFERKQFFDGYRKAFGALQHLQVDGLEFLLGKVEQDSQWDSLPQVAYFLATIKHETGIRRGGIEQTYQPIKELRGRVGTKIRVIQDKYWYTDAYGRGFIQITWPANYAKFGIGKGEYDKALEPETAYDIAARGMRNGMFTKYKLVDFINDREVDYYNARQIVNGHDDAALIAGYAEKFERILKASLLTDPEDAKAKAEAELQKKEPAPPAPQINVEHAENVEAPPVVPKPETVKVQSLTQSLMSKIMAGGAAVSAVITAIVGFVTQAFDKHPLPMSILVLGILAIAAYMYNESMKRRDARQALLVQKAASQTENTVVLT